MDNDIREIIEELNIKIIYSMDVDFKGCYLPRQNLIVINTRLTDSEQKLTLLHELGHACLHHSEEKLYQATQTMHLKMEAEANDFMAKKLMIGYLNNADFNFDTFNAINFIESAHLDASMEPKIKKWYWDYCVKAM